MAGLLERQMRRALAARHDPIHGFMPEGRDTRQPTVARILRAFADDSLVRLKRAGGRLVRRQCARLTAVQQQILDVLERPCPEALFGGTSPSKPCVGLVRLGCVEDTRLEPLLLDDAHLVVPSASPARFRANLGILMSTEAWGQTGKRCW